MSNNDDGTLVTTGGKNNNDFTSTTDTGIATHSCCTAWRKLLERNFLSCASCRKLFENGVYTVQKVGNVCKDCLLENGWKGERQEIYDVILENVAAVSCSNASEGCQELFLPEDLGHHLQYCKFRKVKCVSQGCPWKGKQNELVEHFQ